MLRNLLFHCYPVKGTIWTWHAERISSYKHLFNGRRIVIAVLDHLTENEDEVRKRFAALEAEIIPLPNHRHLHETAYFLEGLSRLESTKELEATFYAHAKGVTRHGKELEAVRWWSEAMYRLDLGFPELVDRKLSTHAAVGCFRLIRNHSGSPWHYSGTFFWLKHSVLFARNWKDVVKERYGVEGYPGRHVRFEESIGFTPDNILPEFLYGLTGNHVVETQIRQWEDALRAQAS